MPIPRFSQPIMKYSYLILLILFSFTTDLKAQTPDTAKIVTIVTKKKKLHTGRLVNITKDSIILDSHDTGVLRFGKVNVKSVYDGVLPPHFLETTNSSVPYYVQTALPTGSGNHYYKNYYVFANEFNFGVTDQLNLSLGFETGTLIFDSGDQLPLIQLGGKYSLHVGDNVHMGLSAKMYFSEGSRVLLLDTPITFGGNRTNITFSPSIYFDDGNEENFGIFANMSLGLSDRSRFIFDYAYIDETGIAAILYEYLFKSGFTISIGALVAEGGAAPNLSFSVPFGNWKIK